MVTGLINGARALHWPTRSHRTPPLTTRHAARRSIRQQDASDEASEIRSLVRGGRDGGPFSVKRPT